MSKAQQALDRVRDTSNLKRGNTVNVGRTPNWLRAEHQEIHGKLLEKLAACMADEKDPPAWLIKALDSTGRFGLGEVKSVSLDESEQMRQVNLATAAFFQKHGLAELYDTWVDSMKSAVKDV